MVMVFLCHIKRLCDIPNDNHATTECILYLIFASSTALFHCISCPVIISSSHTQVIGSMGTGTGDAPTSAQEDRWIAERSAASTSQRRKPGALPSILRLESSTDDGISILFTSRQVDGVIIVILTVEKTFDVQGIPKCRRPQVLEHAHLATGDLAGRDIQLRCAVV